MIYPINVLLQKQQQHPPLIRNYFSLLQTFLQKWQLSEILPRPASGPAAESLHGIVLRPQGRQDCILRKKTQKMVLVHLKDFFYRHNIKRNKSGDFWLLNLYLSKQN